ncbi:Signal transduction histidine kinase [Promicromonospora umidemergens]|uniref:histidine kinase n=1 Tax=Promicromonospora umidemergens TaxID=629679 RepID=A0ABP8YDS3_9MICO|nr:histidine kinase [Promicromonospora umidemergens]MCP2285268.1 Signal transduction histidine kinase [Promicromonospora umidemergens]
MLRASDLFASVSKVYTAENRRGDVMTAAGLLLVALALDALGLVRITWDGPANMPSWWFAVPAVVGCTALVWRRTRPLGALAVATLALGADIALGGSVGLFVIVWESLYAVHLHGRPVARRITAIGVALASLALLIVVGTMTGDLRAAVLSGLQVTALLVMPMWWGGNVRQGRELTAAAHERGRLERERSTALLSLAEAARHDAVRAERTTVARDLHDVVASHLSAITITSGAALAGPAEAERDRAALRSIRAESLASLQDMQAMIRVLAAETGQGGQGGQAHGGAAADDGPASGAGGSNLLAAPRVAQLAPVLEQVRLAGLELVVTDPDGVLTGGTVLPAAVDHAVYRVVRESLTNVLKHGGARAELRVAAGDSLELGVHDDGVRPGSAPDPADVGGGTGLGLLSMRERVESLGGTFAAGPEPGPAAGGWRVRAALPLPDRADSDADADPGPLDRVPSDGRAPGLRA